VFQKLKSLSVNVTIYGVGDVAIQMASFLLLPVYVRVLSPTEYGVVAVLLIVEQLLRVVNRWGVDASFMRFYLESQDPDDRRRLASTLFFFLVALSGALSLAGVAASPWLVRRLFEGSDYAWPLRLVFITTFLGCLSFLPFHVLRIEGRARTFVALTFSTNLATLLSKLLLVVGLRMGVLGIYLADLFVAVGIAVVMLPRYAALIRPMFSVPVLKECLAFGLPRIPHGAAHQVIAGADRYVLSRFVALREVGIYSVGANLGLGMKLFLSAFENAWAPFYFSEMKDADAKATFRAVTTYGVAVLALMVAGLSALALDLVRLMTTPQYYGAAGIVPWIGLGVALQGWYLLTSIGLNITKRTMYYPVATGIGAAASVGASLLLIPRFGAIGAAWSNTLAYAVLAGAAMFFSQRVYPVSYDWSRLARVIGAAGISAFAGRLVLPVTVSPWLGLPVRGLVVVGVFAGALGVSRFFEPQEVQQLKLAWGRLRSGSTWRSRSPEEPR
jgi:O-antigen/teichoic acid export membrane protein